MVAYRRSFSRAAAKRGSRSKACSSSAPGMAPPGPGRGRLVRGHAAYGRALPRRRAGQRAVRTTRQHPSGEIRPGPSPPSWTSPTRAAPACVIPPQCSGSPGPGPRAPLLRSQPPAHTAARRIRSHRPASHPCDQEAPLAANHPTRRNVLGRIGRPAVPRRRPGSTHWFRVRRPGPDPDARAWLPAVRTKDRAELPDAAPHGGRPGGPARPLRARTDRSYSSGTARAAPSSASSST